MGRLGVLAAVCAVSAAVLPAGAEPGPDPVAIVVSLEGSASRAQGEPISYAVTITNQLPTTVIGGVAITLRAGALPVVTLQGWGGRVAGLSSIHLTRTVTPAQWFAQEGEVTFTVSGYFEIDRPAPVPGIPVIFKPTATSFADIGPAEVVVPVFEDVTEQMGITTRTHHENPCRLYAAGAAWGDINADGLLDLYIPQRSGASELWINGGGTFAERAAEYGVGNEGRTGMGANFVDYDADGLLDLFVLNDGVNALYRNLGDGTFADVATAVGLGDDANHSSAAWADFDLDGDLDVFVTSHARLDACTEAFVGLPSRLYRANGDGTFTDATSLLPGRATVDGLGFQGAWFDATGSGRPDLYMGNDQIRPFDASNAFWRNLGTGTFEDVSSESDAGVAMNTMGIAIGDPWRGGNLSLALSDIGTPALLRGDGAGNLTDVAESAGIARADQGNGVGPVWWGLGFVDLNNDGWEDLFIAAGQLIPGMGPPEAQPDAVFVNDGSGRFLDLSAPSGADDDGAGRGAAFADFDRDGRVDMVVINQGEAPHLYRNVTPGTNHWLEVRAQRGGSDACGARITASFDDQPPMTRQVSCGSTGLASGDDRTVHLGLGTTTTIPHLRIDWPGGGQTTLTSVPADQMIEVSP